MTEKKLQCPWLHPAIVRLVIERDAYERAGRPRAVVTAGDVEREIAEVLRRRNAKEIP